MHDHAVARTAVITSDLLGPFKGRVSRHRPARRHMREGVGASPVIGDREHALNGLNAENTVEAEHLVEGTDQATLGAGAVVAHDVNEKGVIQLTEIVDGIHQSTDLDIGVLHEARKGFHLQFEQLLLLLSQLVPILNFIRLVSKLGALGHDAHGLLTSQCFFTQCVPAVSKAALVLIPPLHGNMMRRMNGSRRVVDEERFIGCHGLLETHPGDRLVGHIGRKVIIGVVLTLKLGHTVENDRIPLIGLTGNKAVELVKARVSGPAEERAGD